MDHYSILDHSSSSLAMEGDLPAAASGSAPGSISAGIAAANALLPKLSETGPRFPGEDGGRSLAEMAHSDLDAALQLLAERAQYITEATGVAIALRRDAHNHMLCRASTGSNAPELGALLSTEYGLSGESVRTRQLLRCDDAERDPRVNHDVCRDLGIASVVVMPIVGEDRVLGVFELLSGKPRAFDERDLSALSRLAEMVETAVLHAQFTPAIPELVVSESTAPQSAIPQVQSQIRVNAISVRTAPSESESKPRETVTAPAAPSPSQNILPPKQPEAASAPPSSKKPLFWSAAMRAQSAEKPKEKEETPAIAVPAGLRNLQKCQACGFPVSQGRAFCVECEERQWRGQRLPHPEVKSPKDREKDKDKEKVQDKSRDQAKDQAASPAPRGPALIAKAKTETHGTFIEDFLPNHAPFQTPPPTGARLTISAPSPQGASPSQDLILQPIAPAALEPAVAPQPSLASSPDSTSDAPFPDSSTLFLSSAQSESWFASNKYILGALVVVAIIIAAIVYLR